MRLRPIRWLIALVATTVAVALLLPRYAEALLAGSVPGPLSGTLFLGGLFAFAVMLGELVLCFVRSPTRQMGVRFGLVIACTLLVGSELFLRLGVGRYSTWLEANRGAYVSGWELPGEQLHLRPRSHTQVGRRPEFAFEIATNSEGFRDREYPLEKRRSEFRIIVFGDSFAEGFGAEAEDAWPRQMERGLRAALPDRDLTVVNAGVSGSDVVFAYAHLEQRMIDYGPDLVIVAINNTDVTDVIYRGGTERLEGHRGIVHTGPWWEWIYASSHIVRHVVRGPLGFSRTLSRQPYGEQAAAAADEIPATVLRFEELARERGFGLLVVVHPLLGDVNHGHYDPHFARVPRAIREETDIPIVDVLDYFAREQGITKANALEFFWKQDRHHNARGYAALGEAVTAHLLASDLLGGARQR